MLNEALAVRAVGTVENVQRALAQFVARTAADELMLTSEIFDFSARLRSYELTSTLIDA